MEKLVIEMKIIAYGMVHHVAEAFLDLQVFLPAVMAVFTFECGAAIQTVIFVTVMLFHWVK
jgi:hypothetical protein